MTQENAPAPKDPVDASIMALGSFLEHGIPSASAILLRAQKHLANGDIHAAEKCQRLNYLLHNSSLPNSVKIGEGVKFAYGGIGLIVHKDCEIRAHATIGSNVTLGGRSGSKFRTSPDGKRLYVPLVEDHAYIATGACILGGVTIGKMAIVGANSVVLNDVPALTIVAGQPAKVVSEIGPDNALRYKSMFGACRNLSNNDFLDLVMQVRSERGSSPDEL